MKYLGLDVHSKATVYCVLDAGETLETGKIETSFVELERLVRRLGVDDLLVGQEVGTMSHFVHDAVTAAGAKILSFNAQQLRMIASSRKKTDKRDAWWIAKGLSTGMMPHPVHIPASPVRRLRSLLAQREAIRTERRRWLVRARSYARASGVRIPKGASKITRMLDNAVERPEGLDLHLAEGLDLCARQQASLRKEEASIEATIRREAKAIEAIRRLKTIPAVGEWVAVAIYAQVGDINRFPNARSLTSYAGLVPSVHQSGQTQRMGGITKLGSPSLRRVLVQAGHVLLFRCHSPESIPLRTLAVRVQTARARRKIAVVAAARHILRIAYYVLRDSNDYDPKKLHVPSAKEGDAAAQ
jgi:transposase